MTMLSIYKQNENKQLGKNMIKYNFAVTRNTFPLRIGCVF